MKLKGIDVSHHQVTIDWAKVKSQIDYAILSVGYGDNISSQDDKQFHRNAKECTRLGIPFGVYIYSYAMNTTQARSEAEHVLRLIKGYKLDYPIYYDLEDGPTTGKCSNKLIADMAEVFCNAIEKASYWAGIYANTSWFNNKLTDSRFNNWVKWVAQYNTVCEYKGKHDMWQYASDGKVNGIGGNVDVNYCYVDYPTLINPKAGTPNQITPPPTQSKKKIDSFIKVDNFSWVKNLEDFAGRLGTPVKNLYAYPSQGEILFRVSPVNRDYYSWVQNYKSSNGNYDFAGNGITIDRVQMKLKGLNGYSIRYRVHLLGSSWLEWVKDDTDFAGIVGRTIDAIEVEII